MAREVEGKLLGIDLTDSHYVFAHPDQTYLDPSTVTHSFSRIVKRVGVPLIRLHDLRHTHATLMLKLGFTQRWSPSGWGIQVQV